MKNSTLWFNYSYCSTILCGFNFQNIDSQLFKPLKKISIRENVQKRVLLALSISSVTSSESDPHN